MNYILFSADEYAFTISTPKHWDGIIEYSYDNIEWKIWNGEEITNNCIYMRGVAKKIFSPKNNMFAECISLKYINVNDTQYNINILKLLG